MICAMSDPGTTGFPSPVIAHEYLVHAAPETVYAWLKAHAGELDPLYMSPFSDELLKALLGRNKVKSAGCWINAIGAQ